MCLGVNLCVGLLLASTAATASAAVRYATPTGVGAEPCTAGTPCSLGDAVSGAAGGDQVLLAGGTYTLASTLNVNAPISIEGPPQGYGCAPHYLGSEQRRRCHRRVERDSVLRDSRVVSEGIGSLAAAVTGTITGCTIVAGDDPASPALVAYASLDPTASVIVRNTVRRAGPVDAEADDDVLGPDTASIDIDYSA